MFSLDDARWSELWHAYSYASDVPAVLGRLSRMQSDKQFEHLLTRLMASLWHQNDYCPAALATAPHLAAMCEGTSLCRRAHLITCIALFEVARRKATADGSSLDVPSEIESEFMTTIRRLPELVASCAEWDWDYKTAVQFAGSLLIAAGYTQEGHIVLVKRPEENQTISSVDDETP